MGWLTRTLAATVACFAVGLGSAAGAHAATLSTTVISATPEQAVPVQLTFSGTTDAGSGNNGALYAVARPAGGIGCAANYGSDEQAAGGANQVIADGTYAPAGAPYSVSDNWTPSSTGNYILCAWLEPDGSSNSSTPLAGPITTPVTVRGPQVGELAVSFPQGGLDNKPFPVDYTTQTDQQLSLDSTVKPAGGLPCATSYELEVQQNQNEQTLLGSHGDGAANVFGGPAVTSSQITEGPGNYIVCSWIEGPSSGEVDAALTTPFSIVAPPPVVKPTPAAPVLAIAKLTASAAKGITVRGTTAATLSGSLKVSARCDRRTVTATTTATDGKFSAQLPLPNRCLGGAQLTATVTWAGSTAFAKGTVSTSTLVRRPVVRHHRRHHGHHRG